MDYVKKYLNVEGVIGQGAFGRVLLTSSSGKFALKCVHPILKPQRLSNELRHLRDLGGQCNVVQMHTAYFNKGSLYIVMELIEHDRFVEIVGLMSQYEISLYMKNLLIALKHVHSHNVIHRDIKPANFLYNRREKKFILVDFGLAQNVNLKYGTNRPTQITRNTSHHRTPTTPTSIKPSPTHMLNSSSRRFAGPLFPMHHSASKASVQINTLNNRQVATPTHQIHKSPPKRHLFSLTKLGSPATPNTSTKRQLPDLLKANHDHFNHDFKKLRLTANEQFMGTPMDEVKEPVKLVVGAYESPLTNTNDPIKMSSIRRRLSGDFATTTNNQAHQQHKFSTPNVPSRRVPAGKSCGCQGKGKTCTICMTRPDSSAPKSGTPGYKAPEILLKYPNQTTAIDIWSAGVIFASLLSGHSPLFRDADDTTALAEIISLLGTNKVSKAAKSMGMKITLDPIREPEMPIRRLLQSIRFRGRPRKVQFTIHDMAFDLLEQMLDPNPNNRITAAKALEHPWFNCDETAFVN